MLLALSSDRGRDLLHRDLRVKSEVLVADTGAQIVRLIVAFGVVARYAAAFSITP